jgi:hypothetical protein
MMVSATAGMGHPWQRASFMSFHRFVAILAVNAFLGVSWLTANEEYLTRLSAASSVTATTTTGIASSYKEALTPVVLVEEHATTGPLFHIVFTVESFTTLNLRCIESIFYFHPTAVLKIHSNAVSGIHRVEGTSSSSSTLPIIHTQLQRLLDQGYHLEFVPYSAADILHEAVTIKGSRVNATAAELWASNLEDGKVLVLQRIQSTEALSVVHSGWNLSRHRCCLGAAARSCKLGYRSCK